MCALCLILTHYVHIRLRNVQVTTLTRRGRRRNVSAIFLACGLFGLLLGVCTAQAQMKRPIKSTKPTPINSTAHQFTYNQTSSVTSDVTSK